MIMNELNTDTVFYMSLLMVALAVVTFIVFVIGRRFKAFKR